MSVALDQVLPPAFAGLSKGFVMDRLKARIFGEEHNAQDATLAGGEVSLELARKHRENAKTWRAMLRVVEEANHAS